MKLSPKYACPNCQKTFTANQLRKKAFSGSLKAYQFTPAPSVHCPHCDQKLHAVYPKKHLCWIFSGLFFIILLMIFQILFPNVIGKSEGDVISLVIFLYCGAWHGLKMANSMVYHKADN